MSLRGSASRPWVYAETRAGRIPHIELGRYYRCRRSTLEAWLDAKGVVYRTSIAYLASSAPAPVPSRHRTAGGTLALSG